jgi:hypothetical protein
MRRLARSVVRKNWCAVTVHRRRRWPLLLELLMLVFGTAVWVVVRIIVRVLPSRWYIAPTRSDVSVLVVEVWQGFWSIGVQSKV